MISLRDTQDDRDQYLGRGSKAVFAGAWLIVVGLSLRELIHEFKYQTLVLFKCCLLQPKVISPTCPSSSAPADPARCSSSDHGVNGYV